MILRHFKLSDFAHAENTDRKKTLKVADFTSGDSRSVCCRFSFLFSPPPPPEVEKAKSLLHNTNWRSGKLTVKRGRFQHFSQVIVISEHSSGVRQVNGVYKTLNFIS